MPDLAALCDDLELEHAALDVLVADLDEATWQRPTPAEGWTIRDQIAHLAFADNRAAVAGADPDEFLRLRDADKVDDATFERRMVASELGPIGTVALAYWRQERAHFVRVFRAVDPKARVPWFGPSMSAASHVTARIMETWAHGQDVADALGVTRPPTDRLRHIAFIAVGARRFSYTNNGRDVDDTPIRLELRSPNGRDVWTWGDETATDVVRGDALDFCLVATQRRNIADSALEVRGASAQAWVEIVQAYAGPPGSGRPPATRP